MPKLTSTSSLLNMEEESGNFPPVSVIMCALNEEKNLQHVLPMIPSWVSEVILVDGHSSDNTVAVAGQLFSGIRVLRQPGKGKGDALSYGIQQAKGEIIVTLDADGETPPEEMGLFVKPLTQGYDFVKGSRLTGKRPVRMPFYRWFGNKTLAFTCNVLYGTDFRDVCSGYNAFWKKNFFKINPSYGKNEIGCSMEQQMIVRAKKAGMKIKEVSHSGEGRIAGASVINGVKLSIKQGLKDWFIIVGERFRG
jgi:glycosyltransferase involved in cell wall biosynthesis